MTPVLVQAGGEPFDERVLAREIDRILRNTTLGDEIAALKLWDRTGRIVYSTEPAEIGARYPIEAGLVVTTVYVALLVVVR